MKKILSPWSKKVKKAMIDQDMNTSDLAMKLGYTSRYTSSIINGGVYYEDAVCRISKELSVPIPVGEGSTLARKVF